MFGTINCCLCDCCISINTVGDGFPVLRAAKRRPYNAAITIAPLNNNLSFWRWFAQKVPVRVGRGLVFIAFR